MRYFLGFLVTIGLIILVIVLLVGGGGDDKPKVSGERPLVSYSSTAEVQLTIDGEINANQEHNQVRISVDKSQVTYQFLKGYRGSVSVQKVFNNNETAYQSFLQALARAGFTKANGDKSLADERGYCPLGQRYIFEVFDAGQTKLRSWATSCGGTKTFGGNVNLSTLLFKNQVPDYDKLTADAQAQP